MTAREIEAEMDRILINLKVSREINTAELTLNWKEAFKLYEKVKGTNLCGTCPKHFQMVSDWLTRNDT